MRSVRAQCVRNAINPFVARFGMPLVRANAPKTIVWQLAFGHQCQLLTTRGQASNPKSEYVALACWCSFSSNGGNLRFRYVHSLVLEVVKNKQADRRRQIALCARTLDLADQFRQRQLPGMRDVFQLSPEGIFKADAGLVSINDDGPFYHRGFHRVPAPVPVTVIWQIRNRQE